MRRSNLQQSWDRHVGLYPPRLGPTPLRDERPRDDNMSEK